MINALVVDDERMVRKGLLSLTDWQQYGISFIGEAKDGIQALQFLSKHHVDVMFVDITMPIMNGFELMKRVQEQHSEVQFVILTCHHEFNYVQEALQIGAIDYIVKTLLNRDNVDETVTRILSRLKRDKEKKIQEQTNFYQGGVYLLLKGTTKVDSYYMKEQLPSSLSYNEITKRLLQIEGNNTKEIVELERANILQYASLITIDNCDQRYHVDVEHWLKTGFLNFYFYASTDDYLVISETELDQLLSQQDDVIREQQLKQWNDEKVQYRWLLYPQEWMRWQRTTLNIQPDPQLLIQLAEDLYTQLVQTMKWQDDDPESPLPVPDLSQWIKIEQWLLQLSLQLRGRMTDLTLSHDVVICMIKAIQYMHNQIGSELNQNDIAYQVGMSRSYFSQCFKRFFGVSFGEVLRHLRIETAKQLLLNSQFSISEIANKIGFDDHKYFSRTFKTQLGVYPTEYRSLHYEVR
ncbi:helix-turn-helix domain-containing protein [Paenibacillus endoradicis]|uniref:helix-turn-helix domain-containing protein n=1 Tax=Paenibacillus endoradicis TaxID=2972487 RepID=UPI002159B1D6|nr:response regulator [Paenibacillus endoradicis]MCR8655813.1 response regulator [Paenibacillus endoradicis]MCR8658139.1 response regulator [Paenibacillus endoradicis]